MAVIFPSSTLWALNILEILLFLDSLIDLFCSFLLLFLGLVDGVVVFDEDGVVVFDEDGVVVVVVVVFAVVVVNLVWSIVGFSAF